MEFRMGREDVEGDADAAPSDRLPMVEEGLSPMKARFMRMGLNDQELVALSGAHALGFMHSPDTGKVVGRWTMNPYVFDNDYFKNVLLGDKSKYMLLPSDSALLDDAECKKWVEAFAQDQDLFFEEYANAHIKMSECGQEANLMSEIGEGDYLEPKMTPDLV